MQNSKTLPAVFIDTFYDKDSIFEASKFKNYTNQLLGAQSFTYLMADLCQEKNRMSAFIKVGTSKEHFLEGIALSLHTKAFLQGIFQLIKEPY